MPTGSTTDHPSPAATALSQNAITAAHPDTATSQSSDAAQRGERAASSGSTAVRKFYSLHALGREGLPGQITLDGREYRLAVFIKHDFVAATGFYDPLGRATADACPCTGHDASAASQNGVGPDRSGRIVVKLSRTQSFLWLPLRWLGRYVCRREARFFKRLADVANVPPLVGTIGHTGLAHVFVPGAPLSRDRSVPDGFFDQVFELLQTLRDRGIAYVDTNKPENILLGQDGRPYLIDFQLSYDVRNFWQLPGTGALLRMFHRGDVYHVLKHKRRLRPDELTDADRAALERATLPIRLHRRLFRPYFIVRRRMFGWLRRTGRLMEEGSK